MPQGTIALETDSYTVFPDQLHATAKSTALPGVLHLIIGPQGAWISIEGQGMQAMPPSMKQDRLNSMRRGPLAVAQHAGEMVVTSGEKSARSTFPVTA